MIIPYQTEPDFYPLTVNRLALLGSGWLPQWYICYWLTHPIQPRLNNAEFRMADPHFCIFFLETGNVCRMNFREAVHSRPSTYYAPFLGDWCIPDNDRLATYKRLSAFILAKHISLISFSWVICHQLLVPIMVNSLAPIQGTSLLLDFGPSIVFAVLYGLLIPLMAYRMFDQRSCSGLLIGTISFSIERSALSFQSPFNLFNSNPLSSDRIVIFLLCVVQAHSESKQYSRGLMTYMQISFGLGFIGIASDLVKHIWCLPINATYGSERYHESPAASSKGGLLSPPPEGTPDLPKVRFWARRSMDLLGLAFLAAIIPGIIANSHYSKVFDDQDQADKTAKNRFVHHFDWFSFVQLLTHNMQNDQFSDRIGAYSALYLGRSGVNLSYRACPSDLCSCWLYCAFFSWVRPSRMLALRLIKYL